jgi:rhodanese-related sulfurtransferase
MRTLLALVALVVVACTGPQERSAPEPLPDEITTAELAERLDAGDDLVVIDVRTPGEWRNGTIEGALLFATSEAPDRIDELDPTLSYAIICAAGSRSARFARLLVEEGFEEVTNVTDGMNGWYEREQR